MLSIIRKYISSLFILTSINVISISGCINDNDEITVDLDNTIDGVVQYPPDETDVIYSGFDLRLSPKEDARICAPFLEYMSEETGRTAGLEKKNAELERMNKLFVERETRMTELNKQIAKLEKDASPDKKAGVGTTWN